MMSKNNESNILMDIGVSMLQNDNRFISWLGAQFFDLGFAINRVGRGDK